MAALFEISPMQWVIFLLLNGGILSAAYCLSCHLVQPRPKVSFSGILLTTGLLYLAFIMMLILFFGALLHSLNPWGIGGSSAVFTVGLMRYYYRDRRPFWQNIGSFFQSMVASRDPWFYLFLTLLIMQLFFMLFKVFIVPVHILDSMAYRAVPAPMWYQLGYIPSVLDAPLNEINGRSLSIALLMLWYFLFLGSDQLVNLPQYMTTLILLLVTYAMARQCGIDRAWSLKLSAVVYFMPIVLMQGISTQDHLAVNVAFLASLYYVKESFVHKSLCFMPLLGITVGLMFAFKNNAVVYMPVLLGVVLWLSYEQRKKLSFSFKGIGHLSQQLGIAAFLSVLVGGYWTIKNMILYNNPFGLLFSGQSGNGHPAIPLVSNAVEVSASLMVDSTPDAPNLWLTLSNFSQSMGGKLGEGLTHFFYRVSDVGKELYVPTLENISAFGPQFFSFGLVALALLCVSSFWPRWRTSASAYAVIGVIMLLVYFCIMSNVYAYRNFLFLPVLLLIYFFSVIAGRLKGGDGILSRTNTLSIHGAALFSMLWCVFFTLLPSNANPLTFKEFTSIEGHYQSPARYLRQMSDLSQVMRRMDEIPPNAGVAYVNTHQRNSWNYAFYDVHWQRPVTYIALTDNYFDCQPELLKCFPHPAFKRRLKDENIAFVNLCFLEACVELFDPDFFEIGKGLYFFKGHLPLSREAQ